MWKLNDLVKIKYLKPYVYFVEFDDGSKGEVDLSYLLTKGPIFRPLKNIKLFGSARIEGGTISWPNGADLAPETLFDSMQKRPGGSFQRAGRKRTPPPARR